MDRIKLLDCTLRDGGYVNNWSFGNENIKYIANTIAKSGIEIVELGFIRDEDYNENRAVWNSFDKIDEYIPSDTNALYAVMGECFNQFPLNKIPDKDNTKVDIIRVICWSKLQTEAIEYCKHLVDKGYKVCIQPDRVNQYTIDEFKHVCEEYAKIEPYAIYVVDSNGFLSQREIMAYLKAADEVLPSNINLGYHGHNSLLQAEGAAELFVETIDKRGVFVDGSIYGIGRASGNLNIEIFARYLNKYFNKKYNISCFIEIFQNCVSKIYRDKSWGYSMESFLSSAYSCNPNYANILRNDYALNPCEIEQIISKLSDVDKVITNKDILLELVKRVKE